MSTREDMLQCECRNSAGYPAVGDNFRGYMNAPVDRSVNKSLPWFGVAVIMAALALGLELRSDAILDSKIDRAKAEIRADFAERLAEATAEARQAGDDAAIWKNRVVKLEAEIHANRRR